MCNHRTKIKINIINANRVSINDGNNNLLREQGNICGILMFFNEEKKKHLRQKSRGNYPQLSFHDVRLEYNFHALCTPFLRD